MDSPTVTIKQGELRGCIGTDIDGGRIISFLGIPYAKPPIGELRFKAPIPAGPWEGIRDATKEGDICYSRDMFLRTMAGSEDCLNLNVFTKSLPERSNPLKPVMVWIHGGAYLSGSNRTSMYGPEFLLTQDIVLVSINYRLGALGFLSSEDTTLGIPGNAGLKDQTLALKWVQENISSFNGDPNNVTIFGESAGSASVHFQILSPTAKGLFHKAILQSGSALNYWTYGRNMVKELAKEMGHDASDEKEALNILKTASVESIYQAQEKLEEIRKPGQKANFAPVIEKPNDTAFITSEAIDTIRSGNYNKVPLIIGYNTREGLLLAVHEVIAAMSGKPVKKGPPNLENAIPWQVGLKRGSEALKTACLKIQELYLRGPNFTDDVCVISSDSIFVAGIIAAVKNHLETSQEPIYLYRLSLETKLNVVKNFAKLTAPGTCHGDDLGYLFKNLMTPPIPPGSIEDISVRRIVKLWTNFAKVGNPTPDRQELGVAWKSVEKGNLNFIDIGPDLVPGVNPESERMQLWKEIFQLNPNTANFL
ncbi:hypothetical protein NQ315_016982 [Exocentrus adspersus]|uniref:Carboxylesterase type B domain-containing protein n=1 Tax=Exocentrus adspersus TaxID=1586481 RepID=A0AAV8V8N0_9CUCU|nr:hypothetical protein NQ315_016982 [Exocentrus adspersus]